MIGTKLAHYQITSHLGSGGMGDVYQATDSKLGREVAIKLLPAAFASDPDRLSRFRREAQVLASLNHPNIAQIYGLEQSGSSSCIIMELVEGQTLADRLKSGPFSVEEMVPIAIQIADALAAAHERGIVHRDLKPANIKLTPEGNVKVLDFGLAKSLSSAGTETNLTNSPTQPSGSMVGAVMGTAAYMSPEQARGRPVDARTDIWAFGCVLYEMLTARRAFSGETATDIIAKVLEGSVNWSALPATTPSSIRVLLEEALRKDPRQRLQHVGDARVFLSRATTGESPAPDLGSNRGGRKGWVLAAAMSIAFAVAVVPASLYFLRTPVVVTEMRFETPVPELSGELSISPDGKNVAYVANSEGKSSIWVRPIGSLSARQLPGTDTGSGLFWAPDNHTIAFSADQKLKKIDILGGPPIDLTGVRLTGGPGAWSRDGVILVSGLDTESKSLGALLRISSSGGEVKALSAADPSNFAVEPQFLPDGKHFLYLAVNPATLTEATLYMGSIESKDKVRVMTVSQGPGGGPALYAAPGYLLFKSNGTLMAQSFDADRGELHGAPTPIAANVGAFSASDTEVVIYNNNDAATTNLDQQLQWFDRREAHPAGKVVDHGRFGNLDLSPDGGRAVVTKLGPSGADVWVIDLGRLVPTKLTSDSSSYWPTWSPDGLSVIYCGGGLIPTKIFQKLSTGAVNAETIFSGDQDEGILTSHWSSKSQPIVFTRSKLTSLGGFAIWTFMSGDSKAVPYIQSDFSNIQPQMSPNGRFMAYVTNESGPYQVVIQTFPNKIEERVTVGEGMEPRWSRYGNELFYLTLDGKFMAVRVQTDKGLNVGKPSLLFQTPLKGLSSVPYPTRYDVAPDDQRFLMITPAAPESNSAAISPPSTPSIIAVVNWTAALHNK